MADWLDTGSLSSCGTRKEEPLIDREKLVIGRKLRRVLHALEPVIHKMQTARSHNQLLGAASEAEPEGVNAHMSESSASAGRPIFILGTQRSGTTLLRLMLDSHEHISIGFESGFMIAVDTIKRLPNWNYGKDWYRRYGMEEEDLNARIRRVRPRCRRRSAQRRTAGSCRHAVRTRRRCPNMTYGARAWSIPTLRGRLHPPLFSARCTTEMRSSPVASASATSAVPSVDASSTMMISRLRSVCRRTDSMATGSAAASL